MAGIITIDNNSPEIAFLRSKDKRLAKLIDMVGPISYELHDDPYSFIIHEIIEQMLSIKAGRAIYQRLESLCGGNITPASISSLSDEQIRSSGTASTKVRYIRSVTDAVLRGDLIFDELEQLDDKEVLEKLTSIRGIGNWTAKMMLLFVLGRQDILPFEDGAFLQTYRWLYNCLCPDTPCAGDSPCHK